MNPQAQFRFPPLSTKTAVASLWGSIVDFAVFRDFPLKWLHDTDERNFSIVFTADPCELRVSRGITQLIIRIYFEAKAFRFQCWYLFRGNGRSVQYHSIGWRGQTAQIPPK